MAPPAVTYLPDPSQVRPITDPVAPTLPTVAPPKVTPPPVKLCQYTSYREEASTSSPGTVRIEPVFYWAPACGGTCCDNQAATAKLEDYSPSLCCIRGTEEKCGSSRWESAISRYETTCPSGFERRDPIFGDPRYQR